jgi:hypothetical protein
MKEYKICYYTSLFGLLKKTETAINEYHAKGWDLVHVQYSGWSMCTIVTLCRSK